jgi:hypothetical protein
VPESRVAALVPRVIAALPVCSPFSTRDMASSAVDADFVIVYNARLVDKSGGEGCTQQYSRLLDRLSETGLDATGRPGAKGTGELLVFVKCPEKKLKAEVERERCV